MKDNPGSTGDFLLAQESRGLINAIIIREGQTIDQVSAVCKMGSNERIKTIVQSFIDENPDLESRYCGMQPGEDFFLIVEGVSGAEIRPWVMKPSSLVE